VARRRSRRPAGALIIVLDGSSDLSLGVPGLYTYEGFHNAFLPAVAETIPNIARDGWIMGPQSPIANDDATIASIMRDVISIYVNDYVDQWTQVLGKIGLATPKSKQEAAGFANILAGPTSPLKNLLSDIAVQTKLTALPRSPAARPARRRSRRSKRRVSRKCNSSSVPRAAAAGCSSTS